MITPPQESENFKAAIAALKVFYEIVDPTKIPWILFASTSLIMQGVISPPKKDVDILARASDCDAIDGLLAKYRVKAPVYSSTELYRSCFGQYEICGVKFDLAGDCEHRLANGDWSGVLAMDNYIPFEFEGMKLRLLSLETELRHYENTGRLDKAEQIKDFFKNIKGRS